MLYRYTFLFCLLTTCIGLQAQNCPTSVAGELSNIRTTILVNDTTPTPIYTIAPSGLPNTEFLVVRQDTLAADGFGPPILFSSMDGRVVPADLGLLTCQELCIVPFSYNLSQIQLVTDSLLNGNYLAGATCCDAAGNFFPGICDSLNVRGISSGADIQNLNDVILFTDALAGTGGAGTSIANLVSTINQLNSFITLFGSCAANVPEICYSLSAAAGATDCYQVVLPNSATLILASPDTLAAMSSSSYQVSASYLPNSSNDSIVWSIGMPDLGCIVNGTGMLMTDTTAGTIWVYATGVRGCQEDSILVQISGAIAVRTLAASSISFRATPMPFDQSLLLDLTVEAGQYQLQLVDVMGRVVHTETQQWRQGAQQWLLSTDALPAGSYVLEIRGVQQQGSMLVMKR